MGEIKHSFTAGKMNKDLDERLVPQGQYRNASNIQIRTTAGNGDGAEGGEAGVVQNLQGNVEVGTATGDVLSSSFADTDFTCVGSVTDEKSDAAYFLFTSGEMPTENSNWGSEDEIVKIDTIVEHNVISGINTPIVVDRWGLQIPCLNNINVWLAPPTGDITSFTVSTALIPKIRVNMSIVLYSATDPTINSVTVKIKKLTSNTIYLYDLVDATNWNSFTHMQFSHQRVLNFNGSININGINIIDDLLFWTDGVTEPKKINITRCRKGTDASGESHTQLYITDPTVTSADNLILAGTSELDGYSNDLLEEHVTVLRPAPKTPPTIHVEGRDLGKLEFSVTDYFLEDEGDSDTILWPFVTFGQTIGSSLPVGITFPNATESMGTTTPSLLNTEFQNGDILTVTQLNVSEGSTPIVFKVQVNNYIIPEIYPTGTDTPTEALYFTIYTEPNFPIEEGMGDWKFKIDDVQESKFELKFAKFGYRYKYEDGEYSSFSPWSEFAFKPGIFDYEPVKGYNLGMVNTIKKLVIKDFIPYYTDRGLDVVEIDILYKSTDSANVYTIKSIKKIRDGEWELFTPDGDIDANNATQASLETGKLEIKSEAIHKVIPSNQLLRAFDNVPRTALAQEITGSRILYGNFVQGFDLKYPVGLDQNVTSEVVPFSPMKSLKSLRDYKVGMVFGDKYGRETPVVVSNKIIDIVNDSILGDGEETTYEAFTDDVRVPKELCAMANKLVVKQIWDKPGLPASDPSTMPWMEYIKYYVKETSNEYYNLVLDRWYNAKEEGNIWLSFLSADRNKVDLETYLYLKKSHGEGEAVLEKARYKIIDIENEAPDFIKTDSRMMGMVEITDDVGPVSGWDPNTGTATKLVDVNNNFIRVAASQWEGFLDSYGQNMRGQLFVRVIGRTENPGSGAILNTIVSGEWKKVTHHYVIGDDCKVVYEDTFGESGDMLTRFNNAGFAVGDTTTPADGVIDAQLKYFFEFKEDVVENKPEFDGRFFVLIEKDTITEQSVELTTTDSLSYGIVDEFTISYVDTQRFNPARQGPYSYLDNSGTTGTGYSSTDGNVGVYDGSVQTNSGGGGGSLSIEDPTQAYEWWGWGFFSEYEPYAPYTWPTNPSGNDYDSRQITFFALGCDNVSHSVDLVDTFGNDNQTMTGNYARHTFNYWLEFKKFHKSKDGYNMSDTAGYANNNTVFLDGARANRYQLAEYGTDATVIQEQGEMFVGEEIGAGYVDGGSCMSNDSVAEEGDVAGLNPAPSVFNYKPTALDQGNADAGTLGRITLSQVRQDTMSGSTPDFAFSGDGAAIYNWFAGPSASSTYFSFADDTSEVLLDADGVEYDGAAVYKVVMVDPLTGIDLTPRRTWNVKNFGKLEEDFGDDTRSKPISTNWKVVAENGDSIYDSDFGGANATSCVDDDGSLVGTTFYNGIEIPQGNCFDLAGIANFVDTSNDTTGDFDNPAVQDGYPVIKVGCRKNQDGQRTQWTRQRRCGHCEKDGGGYDPGVGDWGREDQLCSRTSIRFEFRKVDLATGNVTNAGLDPELFDPRGWAKHDGTAGGIKIQIKSLNVATGGTAVDIASDKAVWETEPKEDVGLDLYYEASHAIPQKLKQGNALAFAPLKSKVKIKRSNITNGESIEYTPTWVDAFNGTGNEVIVGGMEYNENSVIVKLVRNEFADQSGESNVLFTIGSGDNGGISLGDDLIFTHPSGLQTVTKVLSYMAAPTGDDVTFTVMPVVGPVTITYDGPGLSFPAGFDETQIQSGMQLIAATVPTGIFMDEVNPGTMMSVTGSGVSSLTPGQSYTVIFQMPTGYYAIDSDVYKYETRLGWHNCWSFGNGVESDRIRDDYNAPRLDNGVKVNTTVDDYGKENRTSSLIFSGLYNTTSGVNDLNEFKMGEKILKNLNPEYGSVQTLKTRETDVVAFCEDRILKVQANKEAVFMADNDPNIVATDRVLGTVSTFKGDYGISKNPESLSWDQYRMYFTDTQRGAVLRLSMDGLTPISNVGMKSWFRQNLRSKTKLLGTFDKVNGEYNLTFSPPLPSDGPTLSFNEGSKGWVSFKSFKPDQGVSVSGEYLTIKNSGIFRHYADTIGDNGVVNNRNIFYNAEELEWNAQSTLTVMFNDMPSTVKSFKAMNYEGSQARIDQDMDDDEYYNLTAKTGWWVNNLYTDLQEGKVYWFVDKENKWFNKISGRNTTIENLDTSEFTVQGLGSPTTVEFPSTEPDPPNQYTLTIENDTTDG